MENKKKKGNNWKQIKFTKEDFNDYAILFFLTIICIIFLYVIEHPLFLIPIVVLIIYGVNETLKKYEKKKSHQDLKNIKTLNFIRIKVNLAFSLWLIGLILTLLGISFLVAKVLLFQYVNLLTILQAIAPIFMITGFFIFFIGRFGKVQFEQFQIQLKYIEFIGLGLVIFGIFTFSLRFLALDSFLFSLIFYSSLITGILCILLEELYKRNRASYLIVLLTFGLILLGIFFKTYTKTQFLLNPNIAITKELSYASILELIQFVSLLVLFFAGGFYLIKEKLSAAEMKKKEKKAYMIVIKISAIIWGISLCFLAIHLL
jgi:hypothetical protein